MTKKQSALLIFLSILIIILLALVLIWEFSARDRIDLADGFGEQANVGLGQDLLAVRPHDWEESANRKPVPIDIRVPESGEVLSEELRDIIAIPAYTTQASPNPGSESLRLFKIRAEGGRFIPEQIIVNFNDTVNIEFTAVDQDYDIVFQGYNMMQRAKQGEVKFLDFQAYKDGRFIYYCESCGGVSSSARGEIVVVK